MGTDLLDLLVVLNLGRRSSYLLKLGGQDFLLINSPEVVKDLIEKRSNIYSIRPDLYIREFGDNLNIALRE